MTLLLLSRMFLGCFSAGFFALAVGSEIRWWRLKAAMRQIGKVVDQMHEPGVEGGESYFPIIQVGSGENLIRFKASHGQGKPFVIGDEINVLFDPNTRQAEWYSVSNRFLPTVVLLAFAGLFGAVALCIRSEN